MLGARSLASIRALRALLALRYANPESYPEPYLESNLESNLESIPGLLTNPESINGS